MKIRPIELLLRVKVGLAQWLISSTWPIDGPTDFATAPRPTRDRETATPRSCVRPWGPRGERLRLRLRPTVAAARCAGQSRRGPASHLLTTAGVLCLVLVVPWIPRPQPAAAVAPSGHALREQIRPSRSGGAGGAATSRGDSIGCHAMIGLVVFFRTRSL